LLGGSVVQKRLLQAYGLFRRPADVQRGLALLGGLRLRNLRALGTLGGLVCRKLTIDRYRDDSSIVLVDEGVLHAIWSVAVLASLRDPPGLERFIAQVAHVDGVISLRPARSTVRERLQQRTDHLLASAPAAEPDATLDRLEGVLDACEAFGGQRGLLIRADGGSPETVTSITADLVEAWREKPLTESSLRSLEG
jgi:hypothetical protein